MGSQFEHKDLANLRPSTQSDEIDLGELIRNIAAQWKVIASITAFCALLGVVVALMQPNQYRIEATISQPKPAQIEALLAQNHVEISPRSTMRELLINLNTHTNVEQAYERSFATVQSLQTDAERNSVIKSIRRSLAVAPQRFDFLGEEDGALTLSQVSVNLLNGEPELAKTFINELIHLAASQTRSELVSQVHSTIRTKLERAKREYNLTYREAEQALGAEKARLAQGLAIAEELGINEPTSWNALIYGNANVQMLNPEALTRETLFLKGTRFLKSQITALESDEAIRNFLPSKANELQAKIEMLQGDMVNEANIVIVPDEVQARIPASAEKPNRKLIVIAATVLGGFLGLFIALIASTLRRKETTE